MINAEVDAQELFKKLKKITPQLKTKLKLLVGISGREWQSHVRKEYFTTYAYGKKSPKVQNRTTFLNKSIRPVSTKEEGPNITGGLNFGAAYAPTHVGPRGQVTTIKPINKKWLTIPLEAAMTPRGEMRGYAPDKSVWGETFIQKTEKGNLIIFGRRVLQKGKRAGQTSGQIVPLFLLRKKVKVQSRIYPEDIMQWGKERFISNLEKEIAGGLGG